MEGWAQGRKEGREVERRKRREKETELFRLKRKKKQEVRIKENRVKGI